MCVCLCVLSVHGSRIINASLLLKFQDLERSMQSKVEFRTKATMKLFFFFLKRLVRTVNSLPCSYLLWNMKCVNNPMNLNKLEGHFLST